MATKNGLQPIYPTINHIYNKNGKRETLNSQRKSSQKEVWEQALSNEWGRLAQGNKFGVQPTDTIDFIAKTDITIGKDVTYASLVCDHRPLKIEPWRVRIVVGGN